MKKKLVAFLSLLALLTICLFTFSKTVSADEQQDDFVTVSDIQYDAATNTLVGVTEPHVNIYVDNVGGEIVADEGGNFSIPVENAAGTLSIYFLDLLTNRSSNITYNFDTGGFITETSDTNILNTDNQDTSPVVIESTEEEIITHDGNDKKSTKRAKIPTVVWVLLVIVIIIGCGGLLWLLYNKNQKRQQQIKKEVLMKNAPLSTVQPKRKKRSSSNQTSSRKRKRRE